MLAQCRRLGVAHVLEPHEIVGGDLPERRRRVRLAIRRLGPVGELALDLADEPVLRHDRAGLIEEARLRPTATAPELSILVALKPSGAEAALHGLEDAVGCPVSPASLIDQRAVAGDSDDQPGLWEVGFGLHFGHRAIDDTEAE